MELKTSEASSGRPPSNWAQLVSAATSLITVGLAVYAVFFSRTSQVLVEYLQSELAYRNKMITNLQDTKETLERSISQKEEEVRNLDRRSSELLSAIATLDKQKAESGVEIANLRREQLELSQAAQEARSQSQQNEFSYIKERLVGRSESVIIAPWVLTIGADERRTTVRRESLWPQYLSFYRRIATTYPPSERIVAERVVSLFEKQCGRFKIISFEIPVPITRIDQSTFERLPDTQIEKVRERALATEDEIRKCMRSVRDE